VPVVDIGSPSWQYDNAARTLLLTFTEPCPRSEPDPAAWRPQWSYTVSIPVPGNVAKIPWSDPNAPVVVAPPPVDPPPVTP